LEYPLSDFKYIIKSSVCKQKHKINVDKVLFVEYDKYIQNKKKHKQNEREVRKMGQENIKRALHSFIDKMDYRLQRKVYFYILGLKSKA
jgi:hypothetical protein